MRRAIAAVSENIVELQRLVTTQIVPSSTMDDLNYFRNGGGRRDVGKSNIERLKRLANILTKGKVTNGSGHEQ